MHQLGQRIEKSFNVIDRVVSYLYENNQQHLGQVVKSTAAEVLAAESGMNIKHRYNKHRNSALCEALILLNCQKNCPKHYRLIVNKLIESYRAMTGVAPDDFDFREPTPFTNVTSEIDIVAPDDIDVIEDDDVIVNEIGGECCDGNCNGLAEYIVNNTEVGGDYLLKHILDDVEKNNASTISIDMGSGFGEQDSIIDAVKSLIRKGYFEVTKRDPYNGYITAVKRIR